MAFQPLLVRKANLENHISVWNRRLHVWQFMTMGMLQELRSHVATHRESNHG